MAVLFVFAIVYLVLLSFAVSETPGLTSLNNNIGGCPGRNESFQCCYSSPSTDPTISVVLTVWSGSAINYTCGENMDELSLSHLQGRIREHNCTKNSTTGVTVIHAYCVSNEGCSTSQLNVTLSQALNGQYVTCSVELSNRTTVNFRPQVLNVSNIELPRPPSNLNCQVVFGELVRCTWSAPNLPDCIMNVSYNVTITPLGDSTSGGMKIRSTTDTIAEFSLVAGEEYQASVITIFDYNMSTQSEAIYFNIPVNETVISTTASAATSPTMQTLTLVTVVVILLSAFCFGRGRGAPAQ